MAMSCVSFHLLVCLSVAYLSGTGLPGQAVLAVAALLGQPDHWCRRCPPPEKLTPVKFMLAAGGLLAASIHVLRLLVQKCCMNFICSS